ncbi:MAG: hypothetical protein Q4D62_07365 [Planctomycetia bacterium]|nr:hypothetical protein [Planctomycetia bacterium]
MSRWQWDFTLPFSEIGWGILAVGMGVLIYLLFRREIRVHGKRLATVLGILRIFSWLLLGGMLCQMTLVQNWYATAYVTILLDDSQSMQLPEKAAFSPDIPARFPTAISLIPSLETALSPSVTVRVQTLSQRPFSPSLTAEASSSAVGTALERLFWEEHSPAAVILLSDGVVTEGNSLEKVGEEAQKLEIPIFPVVLGEAKPLPQLKMSVEKRVENVAQGENVPLPLHFTASEIPDSPIRICLRNRENSGEILREWECPMEECHKEATFFWTPPAGGHYRLELEATLGEAGKTAVERTFLTQKYPLTIDVRERNRKILLLADTPHWEFRYLRNLLHREPSLEVTTWLSTATGDLASQDTTARNTFPSSEELEAFDIVILAGISPPHWDEEKQCLLVDFLRQERPKGLVWLSGGAVSMAMWEGLPLGKILPFSPGKSVPHLETESEGMALVPTAAGLAWNALSLGESSEETRQIWEQLPRHFSWLELPPPFPTAQVLAQWQKGEEKRFPAILFQPMENGAVWFQATDSTWRWRWRNDETYFRRYWVSVLHAIVSPQTTEQEWSSQIVSSEKEREEGFPLEFRQSASNRAGLEKLATTSGGRLFSVESAQNLAEEVLLSLQTRQTVEEEERPQRQERYEVWKNPILLGGVCFLWFVQWFLQRRWEMEGRRGS